MMTTEIAVELRLFFLVTGDAELHLEFHFAQAVHRWDIPMTPQAVDLSHHVRAMPEFHEIRNEEYADPGHRNLLVQILLFLQNLRVRRDYVLMAKKALLDFRQSRMLPTVHERVAETAIDLFDSGMNPVAEIDRLDRPDVLYREKVKKVDKGQQK